jgi:LCP family protein required for cell wall assembly
MLQRAGRSLGHWLRHWPRRKIIAVGAGLLALLLIGVTTTGYEILHHFNANIQQDDISGLLGAQPVNTHPQAENIMVIGSDSRDGLSAAYGTGLVTDQSDTLMIIHIPANRQWAEVMSIPRDSQVNIPACEMGDGQLSSPTQFKINESFAIGNLDGNHTRLGVACTVKTVEQDTGIYINHFIAVNFTGFENMVAALGGVYECNPTPIDDPNSHLHLSAGNHLLTPAQALGYVRARYTIGDGSDLERIGRQQAFMSSLVSRVRSELYNPLAVYRFLDAFTKSLTIDTQLGGITGLYDLGQSLRAIPSSKIAFFTLPNYLDPADTANVLWTQPEDGQIFASFRNDVPASSSLFDVSATAASKPASKAAGTTVTAPTSLTIGSPHLTGPGGTLDSVASAIVSAGAYSGPAQSPGAAGSGAAIPSATLSASPAASPSTSPLAIQGRTANQSICAG